MATYHINAKGEPGKCRAYHSDNCPFGGAREHYSSKESAQAAYEGRMGSGFAPVEDEPVKVKRGEQEKVAATSSDPAELMAVAEGLRGTLHGRKVARALATNPNAPGDVLVTARGQAALAYTEFVELEIHPNYPLDAMTGEGVHMLMETAEPEHIKVLMASDEVGDKLGYAAHFGSETYTAIALENPNNKMTLQQISTLAARDNDSARAAAKSGRFPSDRDLDGRNEFFTGPHYQTANGWGTTREKVRDERILVAAAVNPSSERLEKIYNTFAARDAGPTAARVILKNPAASPELKARIAKDLKSFARDIAALAEES